MLIPGLLREFGVDTEPLFEKLRLPIHSLDNPDATVSYTQMVELLSACAKATACPHFGLMVGQRNNIGALGLIGFLAQNATDVGTALRELIQHLALHDRIASARLKVSDGIAVLQYELDKPSEAGSNQLVDGSLATMRNIMFALCGTQWRPLCVDFRRAAPADVRLYEHCFRAPLDFNAKQNALVFAASWLEQKIVMANPQLRQFLQEDVDELTRQMQVNFQDRIFRQILDQVRSGHCSLEELASHCNVNRRTLNRRLELCNTSFRGMRNEARRQIACELLRSTGTSVEAIAAELGYTSASAFTRAFSQWEGIPPRAWRHRTSVSA